jgi:NADPH:quinone reductase-like Zn-dependent oxidoreductase
VRAAVFDRYGGPEVVRVADVRRPQPRADEVLVRVHAAAVTSGDARVRGARFPKGFGPGARLAAGALRTPGGYWGVPSPVWWKPWARR